MTVWIVYMRGAKDLPGTLNIFDSEEKAKDFKFDITRGLRMHPETMVIEERQVY